MKIDPKTIAEVLMTEFVTKEENNIHFKKIAFDGKAPEEFQDTWIEFYRIVLVLIALLAKEKQNSKFKKVRVCIESLIFPPTPTVDGMIRLQEVKTAMDKLNDLLQAKNSSQGMNWAMSWLGEVGINWPNSVSLAQIAWMWMDYYLLLHETLNEFDPRS